MVEDIKVEQLTQSDMDVKEDVVSIKQMNKFLYFLKREDIVSIIVTWALFLIVIPFGIFTLWGFYSKIICDIQNSCDPVADLGAIFYAFMAPIIALIVTLPCIITSAAFIGIRRRKKDLSTRPYIIPLVSSLAVLIIQFLFIFYLVFIH